MLTSWLLVECQVNIVRVVRHDMDSCQRDNGAIASRNSHNRHSEIHPYVFKQSPWLNSDCYSYVKLLKTVVNPWMERVAAGRRIWLFAIPSEIFKKWLLENFYNFAIPNFWSPYYSNCNPTYYYVWGTFETDTNCSACNTKLSWWARSRRCMKIFPGTLRNVWVWSLFWDRGEIWEQLF